MAKTNKYSDNDLKKYKLLIENKIENTYFQWDLCRVRVHASGGQNKFCLKS